MRTGENNTAVTQVVPTGHIVSHCYIIGMKASASTNLNSYYFIHQSIFPTNRNYPSNKYEHHSGSTNKTQTSSNTKAEKTLTFLAA